MMNELDQAVERLSEAMHDSALLVAAYLQRTGKPRRTTCRTVTERAGMPELVSALDKRVERIQQKGRSEDSSDTTDHIAIQNLRTGRSAIKRRPELATDLLKDPEVVEAVTTAIANDPSATAQVASKVEAKRPQPKSSAGTGNGLVGVTGLAQLLDEIDHAVLLIDDKLPEFTAALREGQVPKGDEMAEEWRTKLSLATQMLELATIESV